MPKASSISGKRQIILISIITPLVVAADQLTKVSIRSHLAMGESLPVTGWLSLTHASNTGAAFGIFQGQSFPLTVVGLIGICVLLLYAFFFYRHLPFLSSALSEVALGLILGGTVGNLIDRLRLGYVTDFIDFHFWPAFNVADSAIVVGALMFVYLLLVTIQAERR
jgi:signal peptidase II